jgi:DNA-binding MarR family transcriptional regulator
MQAEGTALRIDFNRLHELFLTSDELRARILEFVQEQSITTAQIAGCHRLHSAEQRLALWLLIASDRLQSDKLSFTQEFLAEMMGTRRTTVTAVATTLQREGLIQYQRGRITLMSRPKLEIAACYCYQVIRALYNNLYRVPFPPEGAPQVVQQQQPRQRPARDPNGASTS